MADHILARIKANTATQYQILDIRINLLREPIGLRSFAKKSLGALVKTAPANPSVLACLLMPSNSDVKRVYKTCKISMLLVTNQQVRVTNESLVPDNPSPELREIAILREIQVLGRNLPDGNHYQVDSIFYDQETAFAKSAYSEIAKKTRMLRPDVISSCLRMTPSTAKMHFKDWLLDPAKVDIQGNTIGECLARRARVLLNMTHDSTIAENLAMIELYIAVLREMISGDKRPSHFSDKWLWI